MLPVIALIIAIVLGRPASAHTVQPVEAAPAHVMTVEESGAAWINKELSTAGLTVPASVTFIITDTDNCGSKASPKGTGGGCTVSFSDGTKSVLISPATVTSDGGEHILFHEYAHAVENIRSECQAENFSHKYSDIKWWSYLSCRYGVEP
jgi:hypothetical protein